MCFSLRQLQAAQLRYMGQCPDLCLRLAGQIALATAGPELQRLGCHCRSEVHLRCNGELCSSFSQSDCLGTPWNPFGTCGKCAWGLNPSTNYAECIASEPVGTRWNPFGTHGKCAWGPGPSTNYAECIASEPVGTRSEPVANVPGAWAPARFTKSALPRNPLEPVTEPA